MIENFDKIISDLDKNSALREAVKDIITDCKQQAKWCCECKRDEDGTRIADEKGDYIYIEPEEDTYMYSKMKAYLDIAHILAKTL